MFESAAEHLKGLLCGLQEMTGLFKTDEDILTFDISDEALERAACVEQTAFTWVYCTNGYYWYDCSWPQ